MRAVRQRMLEIIYASAAVKPFPDGELNALLGRARVNNTRLGVTGMLLHDNGAFLQVLEGDPVTVKRLFARIAADPRHKRVVTLQESVTKTRSFAQWSMGLVSLSRVRSLDDAVVEALGRAELPDYAGGADPSRARQMLLGFCRGRWRSYVEA